MRINFKNIKLKKKINFGNVKLGVRKVYPELEDLEVTPSGEEQNFKSSKYGFGNVKVKAVESEELNITPTTEEQVNEGLYNKVTVAGDSNLIPDNIKEGTSIFGVEGNVKASNVKITDASYLFYSNTRLDQMNELLSLCENVTNTYRMFSMCTSSTTLDLSNFDTSNVTDMSDMFRQCTSLTTIDLSNFDTSNVTNMNSMFYFCSALSTLDLSSFDMSKVTDIRSMLAQNKNLTNLTSFRNLGKGYTQKTANYSYYALNLSSCTNLTHESLIDLLTNGLYDLNLTYDVANGGTLYRQSCVLGTTNLEKLQATEEGLQALADADAKGWDVS